MKMGDVRLTDEYDIAIDSGDIAVIPLRESYTQNGNIAVFTPYGENIYHPELGNKMWNLDRVKIIGNNELACHYCEDAIISSNRKIQGVKDISVYVLNGNVCCDYTINESDIADDDTIYEDVEQEELSEDYDDYDEWE